MQFIQQLVLGLLTFMMSVGVVWAGERGYQLVVGRDSKLCARMLEAFREDVDHRGRLRYQHEIFRQITWKPVELKGQGPKTSSSHWRGVSVHILPYGERFSCLDRAVCNPSVHARWCDLCQCDGCERRMDRRSTISSRGTIRGFVLPQGQPVLTIPLDIL